MKRVRYYEIIGLVLILAFTIVAGVSCAKTAGEGLSGETWVLKSYGNSPNPTAAVADRQTTIVFDDKKMTVSGNGGVNGYGGNYTVKGDKITFSEVIHTLIAMEGPIMGQENFFFKVLNGEDTYRIDGKQLTITGNEGTLVFTHK